jgi:4-aminobutyrate aminotransferase-like enzyme
MLAIEFSDDGNPDRPAKDPGRQRHHRQCRERGLLIIPAGVHGNVIRVLSRS